MPKVQGFLEKPEPAARYQVTAGQPGLQTGGCQSTGFAWKGSVFFGIWAFVWTNAR